jgi:hypothetical protein
MVRSAWRGIPNKNSKAAISRVTTLLVDDVDLYRVVVLPLPPPPPPVREGVRLPVLGRRPVLGGRPDNRLGALVVEDASEGGGEAADGSSVGSAGTSTGRGLSLLLLLVLLLLLLLWGRVLVFVLVLVPLLFVPS